MSESELKGKSPEEKHDEAKSNHKIAFGSLASYLFIALQIISGIVFIPIISKTYGQNQYGLITLSNSFVTLFLTDIGLSVVATKYLSQFNAEGRHDEARTLIGLIYKIFFLISGIAFVILFVAYFFLGDIYAGLTADEIPVFRIIFSITAIFGVVSLPFMTLEGVLNAYEEYTAIRIINIIQRLLYISFCLLSVLLKWPIYAIALAASGTGLISYLLKYAYSKKKTGFKADLKSKLPTSLKREIVVFSIWNIIVSICWRLFTFVGPSILGIVSDSSNIAVFTVAAQIESYGFAICGVLNTYFLPKLSRIFASTELTLEEQYKRVISLGSKVAILTSSLIIIICVGFASCGQEFVTVWMDDPGYNNVYPCSLIMLCGIAFTLPNTVLKNALNYHGQIKYLAITQIIGVIVFLAVSFALSWFAGALGTAIGAAIGEIVSFVGMNVCYKRLWGMKLAPFYLKVYARQIVPLSLSLLVGLLLHFYLPLSEPWKLVVIAIAVSIVYLPICWFFVFDHELRGGLLSIFFKKKAKGT